MKGYEMAQVTYVIAVRVDDEELDPSQLVAILSLHSDKVITTELYQSRCHDPGNIPSTLKVMCPDGKIRSAFVTSTRNGAIRGKVTVRGRGVTGNIASGNSGVAIFTPDYGSKNAYMFESSPLRRLGISEIEGQPDPDKEFRKEQSKYRMPSEEELARLVDPNE